MLDWSHVVFLKIFVTWNQSDAMPKFNKPKSGLFKLFSYIQPSHYVTYSDIIVQHESYLFSIPLQNSYRLDAVLSIVIFHLYSILCLFRLVIFPSNTNVLKILDSFPACSWFFRSFHNRKQQKVGTKHDGIGDTQV